MIDRARAVVLAAGRMGRLHGPEDPGPAVSGPGRIERNEPQGRNGAKDGRGLVALKSHFRSRDGAALGSAVEIYLFPGGYCGICPVEGGRINLCLLGRARDLNPAGGSRGMLAWAASCNVHLAERLQDLEREREETLHAAGFRFSAARAPGAWPAIGDAAGMIAPVCGDGISMALRSSEIVARSLEEFLAGSVSWEELLRSCHRDWLAEFGPRMRMGSLLQTALTSAACSSLLLGAARVWPALVDWLVLRTRDRRRIEQISER